jgi:insecticidal toxin complex protein TccC
LVYYGYRFYEPGLQRWLNRDPINELGFKLLTRSRNEFNLNEEKNVYAFVGNEPVNRFDPDGRKKKGPITILIGFLSGCDKGAKDPAFRD